MPTTFRLAELLEARGMSLAETARRAGLSVRTIYRIYHNETAQVSLGTLDKLARALDVQPGDLLERKGRR